MRRMVFEVARRCRTLSTAALDPISRKSLGVQTPVELIRSRISALRSSAGPRCGLGVCPIFVVTFRTDLMAFSLSEKCIHSSDKPKITHLVLAGAAGSASPGRTNLTVIMVGAAQTRPRTAPAAHATVPFPRQPVSHATRTLESRDNRPGVDLVDWHSALALLTSRPVEPPGGGPVRSLTSRASSTPLEGQVGSCGRPVQIWVQNWVQLATNIPHNDPIVRIESIVNKR